jgi:hypothetical protein
MNGRSSDLALDIWYGREQRFGHLRNPQRFASVLGRVSPSEQISTLAYSLNGCAPREFSVGPDGKGLQSAGDFNIELDRDESAPGDNQVVVTATDRAGRECRDEVTVSYVPGRVWPLPYQIDWRACSSISDAAQVVDGLWVLDSAAARPAEIGYDRAVAIGDVSWQHYEVN